MTAVWVLLGIALLIFFLLMLRGDLILCFREDFSVTLSVLFLRFRLYPSTKRPVRLSDYTPKAIQKRRQKEQRKTEKARKKAKQKQYTAIVREKPSAGKNILQNLGLIRDLLTSLLKVSFGHLCIRSSRIRIKVATGDAASTAILFGAVNQSVVFLLETLSGFGTLKQSRRDEIVVQPDFVADKTTTDIRLVFSLRTWHILDILFKVAITYLKSKNKKSERILHDGKRKQTGRNHPHIP